MSLIEARYNLQGHTMLATEKKKKKKGLNYKNNEVRRSLFCTSAVFQTLTAFLHSAPNDPSPPLVLIQWKQIHGTLAKNTQYIPSVRRTDQYKEEK